jgi:hypothetical protein
MRLGELDMQEVQTLLEALTQVTEVVGQQLVGHQKMVLLVVLE